ncbi:hypothetical protein RB623_18335 [Mesorhizobium sp. LHD-90]|uniref:hypothetical protein n=1 Tax=Mesorhizobium sp. LHD-90 TaxID=3071414 RepID=UPI0027DF06C9|nr:hypothetical protein [Mesorhizobium sp. LHD-90]MDQ6436019.1 hypothetical protein [Mesorhizobium sp. LHD-90]
MRLGLATLAIVATAAAAQASSIKHVAPPAGGELPSVLSLDPATPDIVYARPAEADDTIALPVVAAPARSGAPATMRLVSPSVLAMQGAEPPVTGEKVAAIGDDAAGHEPIVIRGGMEGDASAASAAPVTLPAGKKSARERKREMRKQAETPTQEPAEQKWVVDE